MRIVARCWLVLLLSASVALLAVPTSGLAKGGGLNSIRQALTSSGKGVTGWWQAAAFTAGLLTIAPAAVNAQEAPPEEEKVLLEADEIHWMDVVEAHHSAALALQSVPAEPKIQRTYAVAYVGDTDNGDAVIIGLGLEDIDKEVGYNVYSTDGLLAENLQIEQIAFFEIGVEGFSETAVLVVKGLSLHRYEPLGFELFPVEDIGGELTMVTYWSGEEEDFPFPVARMRTCEIGDSGAWGKFDIGLTTCSPAAAFRSIIYYGSKGVGFHGGQSRELVFTEGVSDNLLNFLRGLQGEDTLPVDPRGKLPTTWGDIKTQY